MLKIFISNLKEYNNGKIIGEWVSLPCEDIEEVLEKISNSGKDELFISDYETDINGLKVAEYEDSLQLNEIAEKIEERIKNDKEAFANAKNQHWDCIIQNTRHSDLRAFAMDLDDIIKEYELMEE